MITTDITWYQPDERHLGREDSAWYTYESTHDIVASLSEGSRTVSIYADGEMRVHRAYDPTDWTKGHSVIRYCDQWGDLKSDYEIFEATESGRIEWIDNSWFDLYINGQEWEGMVHHSLSEAIESAIALLGNEKAWQK